MAAQSTLLLFSIFRDLSAAIAAATHVEGLIRKHGADIDGAAILARDASGRILVHAIGTLSMRQETGRGAVLGAVVGLMFSPGDLTSAFLGASVAELVDRLNEQQLEDAALRQIGERLGSEHSALLVVGAEGAVTHVADALLGYQSLVRRRLDPKLVAAANGHV